jgi:hypothetical protein
MSDYGKYCVKNCKGEASVKIAKGVEEMKF